MDGSRAAHTSVPRRASACNPLKSCDLLRDTSDCTKRHSACFLSVQPTGVIFRARLTRHGSWYPLTPYGSPRISGAGWRIFRRICEGDRWSPFLLALLPGANEKGEVVDLASLSLPAADAAPLSPFSVAPRSPWPCRLPASWDRPRSLSRALRSPLWYRPSAGGPDRS